MNGHFFTRTRLALIALLIVPWFLLLFLQSVLNPSLSCVLGAVAIICTFVALSFLFTPPVQEKPVPLRPLATSSPSLQSQERPQNLLSIPTTLAKVYSKLSPTEFEIFSAAVIVGLGEGHRFVAHSGKRGDRGVDVRLQNTYGQRVIVQCKCYAPHRRVGPGPIRELGGALRTHNAVYGYVVTTATFTRAAYQDRDSHGFIRTIDGPYLEVLLRQRPHQIAQAYDDIQQQIQAQM